MSTRQQRRALQRQGTPSLVHVENIAKKQTAIDEYDQHAENKGMFPAAMSPARMSRSERRKRWGFRGPLLGE